MDTRSNFKKRNIQPKVAIITYPPFSSGITQYSFYLLKAILNHRNKDKTFLICNKHDKYKVTDSDNIIAILERTRLLALSIVRLIWYIISKQFDIIHFQSFFKYSFLTYFLLMIFKRLGKKVIFTAHDIVPHYQLPWDSYFISKLYRGTDGIIVHSLQNKKFLINSFNNIATTKIIPHPLYDHYNSLKSTNKNKAKQKIGLRKDKRMILFFGRIDRRKGAEAILKEFPKLLDKDDKFHLVFAGKDGFPKGYLRELTSRLDIVTHITIVNRYIKDEEVSLFFTAADAVVLPYLRGTTSGVLKIAFAYKTPVIATKVGDIPETVKLYNAGILIDIPLQQREINKIVSFVQKPKPDWLYSNYIELKRNFSWDNAAVKTTEFYNQIFFRY